MAEQSPYPGIGDSEYSSDQEDLKASLNYDAWRAHEAQKNPSDWADEDETMEFLFAFAYGGEEVHSNRQQAVAAYLAELSQVDITTPTDKYNFAMVAIAAHERLDNLLFNFQTHGEHRLTRVDYDNFYGAFCRLQEAEEEGQK